MKSSFARPGAAPGKTTAATPAKAGPTKKVATPPPAAAANSAPIKKAPARPTPGAPTRQVPGARTNVPAAKEVEVEVLPPEEIETESTAAAEVVEEEVVEEEREGQLALPPATNMFDVPVGQGAGQVDASDFEMPQLKLAQGSDSPLINDHGFADGDLVLNGEAILWQKDCEPVGLTVLRRGKRFMEQLPYTGAGGDFPKIFDTKEQAQEAGLIPFGGDGIGYVPIVDLTVLIKQPDGIENAAFMYEHDGALYAYAMWQIRGSAYKPVARKILTQERTRLRAGLHTGGFKLEYDKVKGKVGMFWCPRLTNGAMSTPEFIEFAEAVGNGTYEES